MTFVWSPSEDYVEHANVTRFMRANGIATYDELLSRSIGDIAWFWDAVVKDLGLEFYEPYTQAGLRPWVAVPRVHELAHHSEVLGGLAQARDERGFPESSPFSAWPQHRRATPRTMWRAAGAIATFGAGLVELRWLGSSCSWSRAEGPRREHEADLAQRSAATREAATEDP